MDIEDHLELDGLFLQERTCRVCGKTKNLLSDFYLTRKGRRSLASSYSYECKECCVKRVKDNKSQKYKIWEREYPDW
jgi:hypothetical protein